MAQGSQIRGRQSRPVRLAGQLGTLLREARGTRPRAELAAAAGVHSNTLADLEQGRANPTLAYLEALGPVYGIEIVIAVSGRAG